MNRGHYGNFYDQNNEMPNHGKSYYDSRGPGLSDEQILNQVSEQKKMALEKQMYENMS